MDGSVRGLRVVVVVLEVGVGGRSAFAPGWSAGADGVGLGDLFERDFVHDGGTRRGAGCGGGFRERLAESFRPPAGGLEAGFDGGAEVGFGFLRCVSCAKKKKKKKGYIQLELQTTRSSHPEGEHSRGSKR